MRRALAALAVVAAALATWALWPSKQLSPEQEVRELVARCVDAAEKRDLGPLAEALAEDFHGPGGAGKQEVKQVLLGHFFRSQAGLVVVNPSLDVTVESPTAAAFRGTFVFARGRTPELLQGEGMSRYEIEGRVEKRDGAWVFVEARWQQ